MDAHEALLGRRTAHAWEPAALPEGVLHRALEAAHHAPCHKHTWPWRFVVLGPKARDAVADLAVQLKGGGTPLMDAQARAVRAKLLDPSAVIALARRLCPDPHRAREDYAAVACAAQNLMVSLHADGFATKWSTGAFTVAEATYPLVGLDPAEVALEGMIFVGRPATLPRVDRPPLDTVVRRVP